MCDIPANIKQYNGLLAKNKEHNESLFCLSQRKKNEGYYSGNWIIKRRY